MQIGHGIEDVLEHGVDFGDAGLRLQPVEVLVQRMGKRFLVVVDGKVQVAQLVQAELEQLGLVGVEPGADTGHPGLDRQHLGVDVADIDKQQVGHDFGLEGLLHN